MKNVKSCFICFVLCCFQFITNAQSDSAVAAKNAMTYADSLVKADHYENWNVYTSLTPAKVISYYGGKEGFLQRVTAGRQRFQSSLAEDEKPALKLLQLLNDMDQWQCLVQEVRPFYRGETKFYLRTSLIGQSTDNGATWKFFDVGQNRPQNVIYMMPDIFSDLIIPVPQVVSETEELAKEGKAAAN